MPKKKQPTTSNSNRPATVAAPQETVEVPDEAISYIVSRYLSGRAVDGVPVSVGISSDDVEIVLSLFVEWAAHKNYVKDGILFIGGSPIG